MSYWFFVPGIPKPQPRVKATKRGAFIHIYTPDTADAWKDCIRKVGAQYRPGSVIDLPVSVRLLFAMPRPTNMRTRKHAEERHRPHKKKPDIDNLAKAVLDALSDWWLDDSLVVMLTASKWYARVDGPPGVEIHISEMTEEGGFVHRGQGTHSWASSKF